MRREDVDAAELLHCVEKTGRMARAVRGSGGAGESDEDDRESNGEGVLERHCGRMDDVAVKDSS